jgi:hypothetical protein
MYKFCKIAMPEFKFKIIEVSDLYFEPFGIGPDAIHSVPTF